MLDARTATVRREAAGDTRLAPILTRDARSKGASSRLACASRRVGTRHGPHPEMRDGNGARLPTVRGIAAEQRPPGDGSSAPGVVREDCPPHVLGRQSPGVVGAVDVIAPTICRRHQGRKASREHRHTQPLIFPRPTSQDQHAGLVGAARRARGSSTAGSQEQHGQTACGPSSAVLAALCDPRPTLVTASRIAFLLPRIPKPSWGKIENQSGTR